MKKLSWAQVVVWLRACHLLCDGSTMHYAEPLAMHRQHGAGTWHLGQVVVRHTSRPCPSFLPCTWLSGLACVSLSALYLLPSICGQRFTCAADPCLGISQSDGGIFGAWHQSLVEVWCETNSMFSFGVSFLLFLRFSPCLQDEQVSPCSKGKLALSTAQDSNSPHRMCSPPLLSLPAWPGGIRI